MLDEYEQKIASLELRLRLLENQQCFCPDCRDKVNKNQCPRCTVQSLAKTLRHVRAFLGDRSLHDILTGYGYGDFYTSIRGQVLDAIILADRQ